MKIFVASPVSGAVGRTNQAIKHRWHLLARAFGPASCVPQVKRRIGPRKVGRDVLAMQS